MLIFKRKIYQQILENLFSGKIIIIYGPRQSGKTTLCKEILKKYPDGVYLSCDNPAVSENLSPKSASELRQYLGPGKLFIIDEAQRVRNIGLTLKILADNFPDIQIIATGSSSFELANTVNEPLTGRNIKYYLLPLSVSELSRTWNKAELRDKLHSFFIHGMYPEVLDKKERANEIISGIAGDNLYKDLLSYGGMRKPELLSKILRLLALQIGNEANYSKIAKELGVNSDTVKSYIGLLERAFVIFTLQPIYKNKYKEVSKPRKIYFYDLGIRNALIDNFNTMTIRNDTGALFENFFIAEKTKERLYSNGLYKTYFWRSKSGQEIDYVEEYLGGEEYKIFECKYKECKGKTPSGWKNSYKSGELDVIHEGNVLDELMPLQKIGL